MKDSLWKISNSVLMKQNLHLPLMMIPKKFLYWVARKIQELQIEDIPRKELWSHRFLLYKESILASQA